MHWSRRYNLTSLVSSRSHSFASNSPSRPVVFTDRLSMDGDRAVTRGTELVQHTAPTLSPAAPYADLTRSVAAPDGEQQLSPVEVDILPQTSVASEEERELITQCMLDIKTAIPQHDLTEILTSMHQRHQLCVQQSSSDFEELDGEWHATKEHCEMLSERIRELEEGMAELQHEVDSGLERVHQLTTLHRETSHQAQLYGRIAARFLEHYQTCTNALSERSRPASMPSVSRSTTPSSSTIAEGLFSSEKLRKMATLNVDPQQPLDSLKEHLASSRLKAEGLPNGTAVV